MQGEYSQGKSILRDTTKEISRTIAVQHLRTLTDVLIQRQIATLLEGHSLEISHRPRASDAASKGISLKTAKPTAVRTKTNRNFSYGDKRPTIKQAYSRT